MEIRLLKMKFFHRGKEDFSRIYRIDYINNIKIYHIRSLEVMNWERKTYPICRAWFI